METRDLKQIIKILEASNLESIEIEQKGIKIKVKKPSAGMVAGPALATPAPGTSATTTTTVTTDVTSGTPVKSPLVGTYYNAPSPEEAPFVTVGDNVKEGQTLCIIEAMKVMNEIVAPCDGKVVKILVDNEEMVEFDQSLMLIK